MFTIKSSTNGVVLSLRVHTGASVSLISQNAYLVLQSTFPDINLGNSKVTLRGVDGCAVTVLDTITSLFTLHTLPSFSTWNSLSLPIFLLTLMAFQDAQVLLQKLRYFAIHPDEIFPRAIDDLIINADGSCHPEQQWFPWRFSIFSMSPSWGSRFHSL